MKTLLITVALCFAFTTPGLGQAASTAATPRSVDEDISALDSGDAATREKAAGELAAHRDNGDKIINALLNHLNEHDDQVLMAIADSLASYGVKVRERLIPLLDNQNVQIRRGAVQALGGLREDGRPAVGKLIELLKGDKEVRVRRWVATSLGKIGGPASEVVPALLKARRDDDPKVRVPEFANESLHEICKTDLQPLVSALSHQDPVVREEAAKFLGSLGSRAAEAVPSLVRTLEDRNPRVQVAAAIALGSTVRELRDQREKRGETINLLEVAIGRLLKIGQTKEVADPVKFNDEAVVLVREKLVSLQEQQKAEFIESITTFLAQPWVRCALLAVSYVLLMLTL
jgi:HEAT repeat protein